MLHARIPLKLYFNQNWQQFRDLIGQSAAVDYATDNACSR